MPSNSVSGSKNSDSDIVVLLRVDSKDEKSMNIMPQDAYKALSTRNEKFTQYLSQLGFSIEQSMSRQA